ncbi:MAG: O-antigen ligase family protein [Lachnospiraceae bacterium]|nr:O-antigen ligase family protein [Lachnospiraceae bacterium]
MYIDIDLEHADLMNDIVMPLAVLLIYFPTCLSYYAPGLVSGIYLAQKLIFLICALMFLRLQLFKNKNFYLMFSYLLWIIVVTYVNGDTVPEWGSYLNLFSIYVVSIYCLETNPVKYTGFFSFVLTLLLLFNTLLWQDGGMYQNANGQYCFVLGTKTSMTEYQIAACCFIWAYHTLLPKGGKRKATILYGILLFSIILWNIRQPVTTSILCIIAFTVLIVIQKIEIKIVDVVLKLGFWVLLIFNIAVVFFNVQIYFANFITNILHESTDLNSRTPIWQVVLRYIYDRPWIGYGVNSNTYFSFDTGTSSYNQATHNGLLYFLFVGGIIGTVLIFILCYFSMKKSDVSSTIGRIVHISMICFGILWVSEQLKGYTLFFPVVLVGFCASAIIAHTERPYIDEEADYIN